MRSFTRQISSAQFYPIWLYKIIDLILFSSKIPWIQTNTSAQFYPIWLYKIIDLILFSSKIPWIQTNTSAQFYQIWLYKIIDLILFSSKIPWIQTNTNQHNLKANQKALKLKETRRLIRRVRKTRNPGTQRRSFLLTRAEIPSLIKFIRPWRNIKRYVPHVYGSITKICYSALICTWLSQNSAIIHI